NPYYESETQICDYHFSFVKSLRSANALAVAVNALPSGEPRFISSQSLGNMIIAAAIADHGMTVEQAWMMDAAIAKEAFDSGEASQVDMSQPEWIPYQNRTWAWRWHNNSGLPANDARRRLTWDDRFAVAADKTYNFYSSSEDVLRRHVGGTGNPIDEFVVTPYTYGLHAWALQEKLKGRRFVLILPSVGWVHGGSDYGGWKLSENFYNLPAGSGPPRIATTSEATNSSDQELLTRPIFDPGFEIYAVYDQSSPPNFLQWNRTSNHTYTPTWISELPDSDNDTANAAAQTHQDHLLAEMIPARTLPTGANYVNKLTADAGEERNFNMPTSFITDVTQWPRTDTFGGVREWKHCDVKDVAYLHLYKMFIRFKELGKLNE